MPTATFTKTGTKATTSAKLNKAIFGVEVKSHDLLKIAYDAYLANGRTASARTKTRGEVTGSTKKPWRQKGTGRARAGSRYGPIWRGGGITFGPTGNENFTKQLNVKAKRLAVRQALSLKADNISVIEDIPVKKTNELARLLKKVGAERNVLLVVEKKTPELLRAARNLSKVQAVSANYVSVYHILNADQVLFTHAALKATETWLTNKPEAVRPNEEAK